MHAVRIALIRKQDEFDAIHAKRRFATASRAAFNIIGRHHVQQIIPRHFKGNAPWVYQHAKRKPKYLKRKHAIITKATRDVEGRTPARGEIVDLVYTGNLRREAIDRSSWTANSQRARVNIRGRVLNIRRPPNSDVDMIAEMTFMPDRELREVELLFAEAFEAAWLPLRARGRGGVKPAGAAKSTPVGSS